MGKQGHCSTHCFGLIKSFVNGAELGEVYAIRVRRGAEGTKEKMLDPVPIQNVAIFCAWGSLAVTRG